MAEYQLTANDMSVIRTADMASIPNDPANRDWIEYQKWLEAGGIPDPYVEPEPTPPNPTTEQEVLYNHETRLDYLEGRVPMPKDEFMRRFS